MEFTTTSHFDENTNIQTSYRYYVDGKRVSFSQYNEKEILCNVKGLRGNCLYVTLHKQKKYTLMKSHISYD